MRSDFFLIKLKYQSNTIESTIGINKSAQDLVVTPITMPDPQSSNMHHI